VSGSGANVTVYGQLRPAENGTPQTVDIQVASGAGSSFKTVQSVAVTSANGTFTASVPNSGTLWRLSWNGTTSREAEVSPK
jgi:hypothetical protein